MMLSCFTGSRPVSSPAGDFEFEHILQDIQTLNERATHGELDITAISIHAYAYVSGTYALLPSGASMGDGYGPMLVAKQSLRKEEIARKKIAVPGTMTSAFLALQLWLGKPADQFDHVLVPFDRIFEALRSGQAEVGLIIHEASSRSQKRGSCCAKIWAAGGEGNWRAAVAFGRQCDSQEACSGRAEHRIQDSDIEHPIRPGPSGTAVNHALRYAGIWGSTWRIASWACT
jgi:hypothetical protein